MFWACDLIREHPVRELHPGPLKTCCPSNTWDTELAGAQQGMRNGMTPKKNHPTGGFLEDPFLGSFQLMPTTDFGLREVGAPPGAAAVPKRSRRPPQPAAAGCTWLLSPKLRCSQNRRSLKNKFGGRQTSGTSGHETMFPVVKSFPFQTKRGKIHIFISANGRRPWMSPNLARHPAKTPTELSCFAQQKTQLSP